MPIYRWQKEEAPVPRKSVHSDPLVQQARQPIPEPRPLKLAPTDYQPSKADLEEEIDMPGMTDTQLRDTFFRPFRFIKESR